MVVPKTAQDIDVYLVAASGGEPRFLAHTESDKYPGWLSWSPDGTELAFVKPRGRKGSDIYIVSVGTRKVRALTTDGKENATPYWWPDGKWISYRSRRGIRFSDSSHVWKQSVDGREPLQIDGLFWFNHLVHSSDGKWAAFTSRLKDGRSGFFACSVNTDGEFTGEPILLKAARLQVGAKPLRWTPDGKLIVLQEHYGEATFSLTTTDGTKRHLSSDSDLPFNYAQWLSDGKHLFLHHGGNRGPGFFNLTTSQFIEMSHESSMTGYREPTISPDGQLLAFVLPNPDNTQLAQDTEDDLRKFSAHLHIVPVEGGMVKQLTHGQSYAGTPRWSPDGEKVACVLTKIDESGGIKTQICVVSVEGGQMKTITDTGFCLKPTWSPDGNTIAYLRLKDQLSLLNSEQSFANFEEMEVNLYVIPASGGETKRIALSPQNSPEDEIPHAWTPDARISWTPHGKQVTIVIHDQAWVTSIDGGEPIRLQRGYIPGSWSSDGQSYLAFDRSGELRRISLDGTTHSTLPVRVRKDARPLSMSPDGETILYRHVASETQCWSIDTSHFATR